MPEYNEKKRNFERYPLEFKVDISVTSGKTKQAVERAVLKNISGDGACFLSNRPEFYSIGQRLELDIHMPGTDRMNARMEGQATVAWIGDIQALEAGKPGRAPVGIFMDKPLSLERITKNRDSGDAS